MYHDMTNYFLGDDILISRFLKLSIIRYFMISCIAGLIDLIAAYICYEALNYNYLLSCNIGIFTGLIFQYFTSLKYVFRNNKKGAFFFVFMVTFFLGLALADGTMWISCDLLSLPFIVSKAASMGIPFFITYFIRKKFLGVKTQNVMEEVQ